LNKITDALVITKRFRSSNEFSIYIEEIVSREKLSYMDAVIRYCEEVDIDIAAIKPLITKQLKDKIQLEAIELNMMKPKGQLPV
jgi:hypothetical protein